MNPKKYPYCGFGFDYYNSIDRVHVQIRTTKVNFGYHKPIW